MPHLEQEAMRWLLGGERKPQEAETVADHLVSCESCRALAATVVEELRAARPGLRGEGLLQLVFDLIDRDRQRGMDSLAAMAEWAELRRLSNRRSQRERVRMTKACHTTAFFDLILGELEEAPSWDEAEFLAGLALLSVEGMTQRQQITQATSHDAQAKVWTTVANARRRAAEWKRAHDALAHAEKHRKEGTGDRRLEARLLSITASTLADEGQVSQALEALERCRAIYDDLSEWALLARTLVQTANVLEQIDPARGLRALDHAIPLIPAGDPSGNLFAEMLRVECLIELSRPHEALQVFRRSSHLIAVSNKIRPQIRGMFTSARLLDALKQEPQAERLFNEVVDSDIEHELYKDAFLDLLYLYGRHLRSGETEKAVRVCRRVLTDASLAAVAHDELREVWNGLLEAAQSQAIGEDALKDVRQYLSVHWKHPAGAPPVVFR